MDNNDSTNINKQSTSKDCSTSRIPEKKINKHCAEDNDSRSNSSGSRCSLKSRISNRTNESRRKSDHRYTLNADVNDRNIEAVMMRKGKQSRYKRNSGKVQKRKPRRRYAARQSRSFPAKKRNNRDDYLSCNSSRQSLIYCVHCGHRCCRRRLDYYWSYPKGKRRRHYNRYERVSKKYRRIGRIKKRTRGTRVDRRLSMGSAEIQVGSTCVFLSPLCVSANPPTDYIEEKTYHEITPELIYQAMRELSMWRQNISTQLLFEYLQNVHHLNPDLKMLWEELAHKLIVAEIVGIVTKVSENVWAMATALQRKGRLPISHVTLFWRVYMDTMRPVSKKQGELTNTSRQGTESNPELKAKNRYYAIL